MTSLFFNFEVIYQLLEMISNFWARIDQIISRMKDILNIALYRLIFPG